MTSQIRDTTNPGPRKSLADEIWTLMQFDLYRPELHYMRGPGPRWRAKHEIACASLDGTTNAGTVRGANNEPERRNANLSVKRSVMLQAFKNWPNATFAAICAAGVVLCVLLPLSIATSLVASSSSSVNAEPPGQACFTVSEGEYQGAYRKNLLLTRFGTYERVKHFGRYSYWYCR